MQNFYWVQILRFDHSANQHVNNFIFIETKLTKSKVGVPTTTKQLRNYISGIV